MSYGKRRSDAYLDEQGPKKKRQRRSYKEVGRDLLTFFEEKARSDQRLQNAFESIFEKYGQDFSGVGDEIDLQSGRIMVDNGHVKNLSLVPDDKDYSRHALRGAKPSPKRPVNTAKRRSAPARLDYGDSDSSDTIMRSPGPPPRRSPQDRPPKLGSSIRKKRAKSRVSGPHMPRHAERAKASHGAWTTRLESDDDHENEGTEVAAGKPVRKGASPGSEPGVAGRKMTNVRVYVPQLDKLHIERKKRNLDDAIWGPSDEESQDTLSDNDSLFGGLPQDIQSLTEARNPIKSFSEDGDLFVTPELEDEIDDAQLPTLEGTRGNNDPIDATSPAYNTRRSVAYSIRPAKSPRNDPVADSEQTECLSTVHSSLDQEKQRSKRRPEESRGSTSQSSTLRLPFPQVKLAELGTSLERENAITQHNTEKIASNLLKKGHEKASQIAEEIEVAEISTPSSTHSKKTAAMEIESVLESDESGVPKTKVKVPRKRKKGMLFVVGKHRKALYRTPQKSSPGSGRKGVSGSKIQLASDTPVATPSRRNNSRPVRGGEALSSPAGYLKPEFYKPNGRPKQRLLSSSLDSNTARRLLSS